MRHRPCHALALLVSLSLAALQLACGPVPAPASDACVPADVDATDAGIAADGGVSGDAADGCDAARDSGTTNACPGADPVVQAIASTSRVTFRVTNQGASTVYLVTAGWFCDGYSIRTASGGAVPQRIGFNCGCECPNPGAPEASAFVAVEPGASQEVVWDARRLVTYNDPVDCAAQGWGDFCADSVAGAKQPVAPGEYSARIGYVDAIPEGCSDDGSGQIVCSGGPTPGGYPYDFPPAVQQLCPGVQVVAAGFTLTDDSAQLVEVLLGEPGEGPQ